MICRVLQGGKMTLYESMVMRRSVRKFRKEKVSEQILEGLVSFYNEMEPLFPGIRTSIEVIEEGDKKAKGKIRGVMKLPAPCYLAIYTEDKEKADMNAGYIMQQLSLYLFGKGVGSCYQGTVRCKGEMPEEGMRFAMLLAFGYPKGELCAKEGKTKRLPMEELCAYKEQPMTCVQELLEAARIAPSSMNGQPWRFVVYENRIHVFCRKHVAGQKVFGKLNEFDFGVMMANVMVAAEELWVDVDLIRLDNITHISLPNNEYVISILIKEE